eukprot:IDg1689t1
MLNAQLSSIERHHLLIDRLQPAIIKHLNTMKIHFSFLVILAAATLVAHADASAVLLKNTITHITRQVSSSSKPVKIPAKLQLVCPCSPTTKERSSKALLFFAEGFIAIGKAVANNPDITAAQLRLSFQELYRKCIALHGAEDCINVDALIRGTEAASISVGADRACVAYRDSNIVASSDMRLRDFVLE